MWGPCHYRMRGWRFEMLLFPRPQDAALGEMIPGKLRLILDRDGPDFFLRRTSGIRSSTWTGLEFDWPPRLIIEHA